MNNIEELLQHYEGVVYQNMGKYSQFTIDFIDDAIIDLPEEEGELQNCVDSYKYKITNIIEVLKDGIDKDLFIEMLYKIELL